MCPQNKLVFMRIEIEDSGSWSVDAYGKPAKTSPVFSNVPKCLDVSSCCALFKLIEVSTMCIGNNGFDQLCRSRSEHQLALFFNRKDEIEAYEQDLLSFKTIRNLKCELIITPNCASRCAVCSNYRDCLFALVSKKKDKTSSDKKDQKKTRNDRLSRKDLENKTKNIQREKSQLKRKLSSLKDRLRSVIEEDGEVLDDCLSTSLSSVMDEKNDEILSSFPPDSPQMLFWQQQIEAATKQNTQRRWHPLFIKWCIALHSKSPSAYRFIKSTYTLILPCESTLRDYTHFTTTTDGINVDLLQRIKEDIKFDTEPESKRNVSLVFDEIKIKSGLVYKKSTGKLVGFCNLGQINEEIQTYVDKLKEDDSSDSQKDGLDAPLATHVLATDGQGHTLSSPGGFCMVLVFLLL
ncbi:uncharacterized protein LOC144357935 [Saccoglossus kowalevskii]